MKSRPEPIRLDLDVRELPPATIGADSVESMVRSFALARVRCTKHGAPVSEIHVGMKPGKAAVTVTPCCARPAKDLKIHFRKLKAVGDDRVHDAVRPGQHIERQHDPPPTIAVAPPTPFVPFTTSGTGRKAVSREVAALYAQAGRLQHIARVNDGEEIDVYSSESAGEELLSMGPDGRAPPCTVENIRIQTRKMIAEATKLALRERRPLSDYAAFVDWDDQFMHVQPASQIRATFVEAGDVPNLVEELDANAGETLLVFIFANNRYDRTMRITARGFVVGNEGTA
jgi:hypothetical protein